MQQTTMRFHTWLSPEEYHNERDAEAIARENAGVERGKTRWIDPQGEHKVMGPGESLQEAFDVVFGEAIADYNARQKRADRKMTVAGYMQSVENDRRGRPVKSIKIANDRARKEGRPERKESGPRTHYEVIFSLGNVKPRRDDTGKIVIDKHTGYRERPNYVPADVVRAILEEYLEKWDERNPNLHLRRVDYHNDEWYKVTKGGMVKPGLPGQWLQGQSHGHIDFVPWAEGYQRGPKRQLSITKAFAAMGFVDKVGPDGRTVTAWEQWQDSEQAEIREIALKHGYEIVSAHDSREALAADEYAELAEVKEAIQDARAELTETQAQTGDLKRRARELDDRADDLDAREAALDTREGALDVRQREQDEQRERLEKAAKLLEAQKREAADLDGRLPRLRRSAQAEQDKAEKAKQEAEEASQRAAQWSAHFRVLEREEQALQARITALRDKESDAYRDAWTAGAHSSTGQATRMASKQADTLTDEQKRENARRDGVGRLDYP